MVHLGYLPHLASIYQSHCTSSQRVSVRWPQSPKLNNLWSWLAGKAGEGDNYHLENVCHDIDPNLAKKRYVQFRHGNLPLNSFKSKWLGALNSIDQVCHMCGYKREDAPHLLFFCPAYKGPQVKWLIPICRELGTTRNEEAYRILQADTTLHLVFALSRFLFHAWMIRKRKNIVRN